MEPVQEVEGIRYLSESDLKKINEIAISFTPKESLGVMFPNDLTAIQQKPALYRYYESCEDIFVLASVLFIGLSQGHAFENGNNRTAFISVCIFLEINGFDFEPDFDSIIEIATAVKNKCPDHSDPKLLSSWFHHYSKSSSNQNYDKSLSFAKGIIETTTSEETY